ncbi:MAG: hypothetical protein OXP69_24515 [Spirochaetaceae bacterium]|nr:hypothetical protein [Spirochaetaceae bacterium]
MSPIVAIILAVATTPSAADVDHSKDLKKGNCLVRSYAYDFTEEITDILIICHGDLESGTVRVDYFPITRDAEISFWDRALGTSAWTRSITRIPEVVIRFDDKPVIRLTGGMWSEDVYGKGSFSVDGELDNIISGLVSAKRVRYRVTYSKDYIGEVKEILFPPGMPELVGEFVRRAKATIDD